MKEASEIIISFSKLKIFFLFFGSLIFVYVGYAMLFDKSIFINFIGVFSIIFFGYGIVTIGIILFDFSPGLIINSKGIFDNSSGMKAGMILWDEITDVTLKKTARQDFITIHVVDPKKYLKNSNIIKNFFAKMNNSIYESPIHISSTALDINFYELYITIEEKFKLHGKPNKS